MLMFLGENTTYDLTDFGITVESAEINYLTGLATNVQDQLDDKVYTFTGTVATAAGTAAKTMTIPGHFNSWGLVYCNIYSRKLCFISNFEYKFQQELKI